MKTDAQLIDEARNDPDALGELYRRHVRTIHAFFWSRAPRQLRANLRLRRSLRRRSRCGASVTRRVARRFRGCTASHAICFADTTTASGSRRELANGWACRSALTNWTSKPQTTGSMRNDSDRRWLPHSLPLGQRQALKLRVVDERRRSWSNTMRNLHAYEAFLLHQMTLASAQASSPVPVHIEQGELCTPSALTRAETVAIATLRAQFAPGTDVDAAKGAVDSLVQAAFVGSSCKGLESGRASKTRVRRSPTGIEADARCALGHEMRLPCS